VGLIQAAAAAEALCEVPAGVAQLLGSRLQDLVEGLDLLAEAATGTRTPKQLASLRRWPWRFVANLLQKAENLLQRFPGTFEAE